MTFDEIHDFYDEQWTALAEQGFEPKFVLLTPVAYWILYGETHLSGSWGLQSHMQNDEKVWFRGEEVVVNPQQEEFVIVLESGFVEACQQGLLARVRNKLRVKRLGQELKTALKEE